MIGALGKLAPAPAFWTRARQHFCLIFCAFDVLAKSSGPCVLPLVMQWLQQLGFESGADSHVRHAPLKIEAATIEIRGIHVPEKLIQFN
jgi:hypothetical protein